MSHPSSTTNLWNQGTAPQLTAAQMWSNFQPYAAYGGGIPYAAPGYAPYAAGAMQNGGLYVPPTHPGYAQHTTANPAFYAARYEPPAVKASQPGGYRVDYGMDGPPTKKRLTSENQLYGASSATTHHAAPPSSTPTFTSAHDTTSQSTPATPASDWPPSLMKFVTRCYESTSSDDTPALERKLTEMIKLAEQSKTLWTRDWDAMPVPALPAPSTPKTASKVHFSINSTSGAKSVPTKSKIATKPPKSSDTDKSAAAKLSSNKASAKHYIAGSDWEEERKREQRASRFGGAMPSSSAGSSSGGGGGGGGGSYGEPEYEMEEDTIVGTNTNLEKAYLRLTERPVPSDVRPVSVLKQSIALMRKKKEEGASWSGYLAEQMKSIRLDLVIQAVADEFALEVYETNARWCLENDDVAEFKRCLLRIDEFYHHLDLQSDNSDEFCCYSLLYHLLSEDFPSLNAELTTLGPQSKKHPAILHAIRIAESYLTNNWHQFYLLSKTSFFLESHILNIVSDRVLIHALESIFISYRPSVPIEWLQKQTGFSTKQATIAWLEDHDCVFTSAKRTDIDAKDSLKGLMEWQTKNKPGK